MLWSLSCARTGRHDFSDERKPQILQGARYPHQRTTSWEKASRSVGIPWTASWGVARIRRARRNWTAVWSSKTAVFSWLRCNEIEAHERGRHLCFRPRYEPVEEAAASFCPNLLFPFWPPATVRFLKIRPCAGDTIYTNIFLVSPNCWSCYMEASSQIPSYHWVH